MSNYLGIEFGSTRIKAVVIDDNFTQRSTGDYVWKSDFTDGVWTYSLDQAFEGLLYAVLLFFCFSSYYRYISELQFD